MLLVDLGLPDRDGRDVIRDSWVAHSLSRIWAQGWTQLNTEANATDINRNMGGEQLLAAPPEYTHLVMLDADHRHPPAGLALGLGKAQPGP